MSENKQTKKTKKPSVRLQVFDVVVMVILVVFAVLCLFPFINLILTSFSTEADYYSSKLIVIPYHFNVEAYRYIFLEGGIPLAFWNSVIMVVCGVCYSMLMTSLGAYSMTKKDLPGRKIFFTMVLITMFFSGGVIPLFLVIKELGLYNSLAGCIIPFGINVFNMIVLRNFFAGIPADILESAKLDGANDFQLLFLFVLPLTKAGFATIALFYFVGQWNEWYWPMLLLNNEDYYPLALLLRNILSDMQAADYSQSIDVSGELLYSKGQDAASVIVSIIPILCIYPFVQKYFVKGVMLGSVKT